MIHIPMPNLGLTSFGANIVSFFVELLRRSVDGTTGAPVFVDETNQRVGIGTNNPQADAKLTVNGKIAIAGAGDGLILKAANGNTYELKIITDANSREVLSLVRIS